MHQPVGLGVGVGRRARVVSSRRRSGGGENVGDIGGTASTLTFVTGNVGKVARLKLALEPFVPGVEVRGVDLDVVEIQADTVLEVAQAKARAAFDVLGAPLVVHDCGLCIEALNDYPGPYTKYVNYTLGTEGILALMRGRQNRRAGWADAVVFVDAGGAMHSFTPAVKYTGEIARHPPRRWVRFVGEERAVGRVFVPTDFGLTECLADVEEEDYQRYRRDAPSVWNDFAAWWGGGVRRRFG